MFIDDRQLRYGLLLKEEMGSLNMSRVSYPVSRVIEDTLFKCSFKVLLIQRRLW